jgi:predicted Zn-dependent peptidase
MIARSRTQIAAFTLMLGLVIPGVAVGGCADTTPPSKGPQVASAPPITSADPAPTIDPLGPPPTLDEPAMYTPPSPIVFDGPGGSKVWLIERKSLPIVSISLVVPYGAALDPTGLSGLAHMTADMLDEGAGTRDALTFSSALDELGAKLSSATDRDMSVVSLEVLSDRLDKALPLMGDAIVKPRHDKKDFERVTKLWKNALKARGDDPSEVARTVTTAVYFGEGHPYAPPVDGTLESAAKLSLVSIAANHKKLWRPDVATFVIVGQTNREAVSAMLNSAFQGWTAPKEKAPVPAAPASPKAGALRTIVVDRPGAPQVVMSIVREGVTSASTEQPLLSLMNVALGGSFTSRLNQNLREKHGWTYGARSRFNLQRGAGMFVARAAIKTDAISPALKEALAEVRGVASGGLSDDEVHKVKAQMRADAVDTYGTSHGIASSLASNAGLGLGFDADATTLKAQGAAQRATLNDLAKSYLSLDHALIVLVGPRAEAEAALSSNGLPAPEIRDADGNLVKAGTKPAKPPTKLGTPHQGDEVGKGQGERGPVEASIRDGEPRARCGEQAARCLAR